MYRVNGVQVKQVDSVKYLGHFLTCELSDDIDIRRQCCVLNVRGNILSRKFHMCSVPVKAKCYPGFVFLHNLLSIFTFLHIHEILLSNYRSVLAICLYKVLKRNKNTLF